MSRNGLDFDGGFGNTARDNFLKFELENEVGSYLRVEPEAGKIYIRLFAKTGRLLSEGYFNKSSGGGGTSLVDVQLNELDRTLEFTFDDETSLTCDLSPLYAKIDDINQGLINLTEAVTQEAAVIINRLQTVESSVSTLSTDLQGHLGDTVSHITEEEHREITSAITRLGDVESRLDVDESTLTEVCQAVTSLSGDLSDHKDDTISHLSVSEREIITEAVTRLGTVETKLDVIESTLTTVSQAVTNISMAMQEHIANSTIHVTQNDKLTWNSKLDEAPVDNKVYGRKNKNWIEIDPNANIGRDFTTNITVGYLNAGTQINSTDKIKDIIYRMLYKEITTTTVYLGASTEIPSGITGLTPNEVDINEMINNGLDVNIVTGIFESPYLQYTTIVCDKSYRLTEWKNKSTGFGYEILTVSNPDFNIYYKSPSSFDANSGGEDFILKFTRS